MHKLRRTVVLAAMAAAGVAAPSTGAHAEGVGAVTGIPCTLAGQSAGSPGRHTATISCLPWIDLQAATEGSAVSAGTVCGTVQVGSADANGPFRGVATTCDSAVAGFHVGRVTYAAGDREPVYLCTYVTEGDKVVAAYDANNDARDGSQCATVTTDRETTVSLCQGGSCLFVARRLGPMTIDPFGWLDPLDPTGGGGWNCAGCLSGMGPNVDDVYEEYVDVVDL